jgi:hypothetical protein
MTTKQLIRGMTVLITGIEEKGNLIRQLINFNNPDTVPKHYKPTKFDDFVMRYDIARATLGTASMKDFDLMITIKDSYVGDKDDAKRALYYTSDIQCVFVILSVSKSPLWGLENHRDEMMEWKKEIRLYLPDVPIFFIAIDSTLKDCEKSFVGSEIGKKCSCTMSQKEGEKSINDMKTSMVFYTETLLENFNLNDWNSIFLAAFQNHMIVWRKKEAEKEAQGYCVIT